MHAYLDLLRRALDGADVLVLGTPRELLPSPLPGGVSIVVTTSGSTTGVGRPVGLTPQAITASAAATHDRLGGEGQWLLTLPRDHIAGLQVCARSLLAGHDPVVRGREPLHRAIRRMEPSVRHYTSLVPTQLVRILDDGGEDLAALQTLDAILLGGSSIDPTLLTEARSRGLPIHTTYGSSETAGGCVYDGRPLAGVRVRLEESGRILLGGPTLAWGYLDGDDSDFIADGGQRWFRTSDLGAIEDGTLTVVGRADDVIISGGVNVHPVAVENALRELPGVADCTVVGVPSTEWGTRVVALVRSREGSSDAGRVLDTAREHVRAVLGEACAPRGVVLTDALPTRGPGKVDRRAARDLVMKALAEGTGAWR